MLVTSNGLVKVLAISIAAEMEALTPPILVQVGGEVVVVSCEGGVLVSTFLILVVSRSMEQR